MKMLNFFALNLLMISTVSFTSQESIKQNPLSPRSTERALFEKQLVDSPMTMSTWYPERNPGDNDRIAKAQTKYIIARHQKSTFENLPGAQEFTSSLENLKKQNPQLIIDVKVDVKTKNGAPIRLN